MTRFAKNAKAVLYIILSIYLQAHTKTKQNSEIKQHKVN